MFKGPSTLFLAVVTSLLIASLITRGLQAFGIQAI